jgi:uncharacterized repeat protein (TIGR04052 family)
MRPNHLAAVAQLALCALAALLGGVVSCSGDGQGAILSPPVGGAPRAQSPPLQALRFEARVGVAAFSCARPSGPVGLRATTVEPLDFRLYVHELRLLRADGSEVPFSLYQDGKWQLDTVALLDFEDRTGTCSNGTPEVNTEILGSAPEGAYVGVAFKIGVPFALNHGDAATARPPLNLTGLFWNWNAGYKFARIDVRGFHIHIGSTGCEEDASDRSRIVACQRENVGAVRLTGFDPRSRPILVDYGALVAGSELGRRGGSGGCMAEPTDPNCPPLLSRLGINPDTGEPDASKQALFRVE